MSMSILEESFNQWETKFQVKYPNPSGRTFLINTISKEIGLINGKWRNRQSGAEITDLQDYITNKVKSTKLPVTPKHGNYVSPFPKRSEERAAAHANRTKEIIEREIEKNRIAFKSESAKAKVISLLAENFLPTDEHDGIRYHKIFNNSIPSTKSWKLDELFNETGVTAAYIDLNKTSIQKNLYHHELKTTAEKIVLGEGRDPKNEMVMAKAIASLKAVESEVKVGKTIQVYQHGQLQDEFLKKLLLEEWKDPEKLTLHDKNIFNARAAVEVDKVNSLDSIKDVISEIDPPSQSTSWEF